MVWRLNVGRVSRGLFIACHLALCLAAAIWGSRIAVLLVCLASLLAILRYASMAVFAASLGSREVAPPLAVPLSLWITSLLGLVVILVFAGRLDKSGFYWAAATALLGPALATLIAAGKGFAGLAMARGRRIGFRGAL